MIKLSEEELRMIYEVQSAMTKTLTQLGECHVNKAEIQQQIDNLMVEHKSIKDAFDRVVTRLEARYGEGHVNLADGSFVPKNTNNV